MASEDSTLHNFQENLSLLCSYHKSVSEVCRKLGIHRSQFNKYLHSNHQPSRHTLRRICDFFGVEEYEIFLPYHQFSRLLQIRPARPQPEPEPNAPLYQEHIERLQRASSSGISRYAGYYFEYYYSMSYPGAILRTLVRLYWDGRNAYYKRLESINAGEHQSEISSERGFRMCYKGMAFFLGDRLFLIDYETLTQNEISQTILFPSYKSRATYLTGLKMGAAAESRRMPICARVVYEVLGSDINVRAALRMCGLFSQDSGAISPDVKRLVKNTIDEGQYHLEASPV